MALTNNGAMKLMSRINLLACSLFIYFLIACTTTQTEDDLRLINSNIDSKKINIVVLYRYNGSIEYDEEAKDCIKDGIEKYDELISFFSPSQFRNKMFPFFQHSTKPKSRQEFSELMNNSDVVHLLTKLNIDYLVVIQDKSTQSDSHGGIFCGGGPGGAGCLGLSWWDRVSDLDIDLWDVSNKSPLGQIKSHAKGTGVMPAFILPVPIYMPATETATCDEAGKRIAKALLHSAD